MTQDEAAQATATAEEQPPQETAVAEAPQDEAAQATAAAKEEPPQGTAVGEAAQEPAKPDAAPAPLTEAAAEPGEPAPAPRLRTPRSPKGARKEGAVLAAFWAKAAPKGRCSCKLADLEELLAAAEGIPEGRPTAAEDGTVTREAFLTWLLGRPANSPELLLGALRARAFHLIALAEAGPKPCKEAAWPNGELVDLAEAGTEEGDCDEALNGILASFCEQPTPTERAGRHFLRVSELGLDPNSVPFPYKSPPPRRSPLLPSRPGSAATRRLQDTTPFPLPHACEGAPCRHPAPDEGAWAEGGERETGAEWVAGHARSPGELRSKISEEAPLDLELVPWPTAASGVIAADECTEAQLKLIEKREERGPLTPERLAKRRKALAQKLGEKVNWGCQVPGDYEMNARVFEEVFPELERDAALQKMQERRAADKAAAALAHDQLAEAGAKFVAWPLEGQRCWPPVDEAWTRHGKWFARWRSQPTPATLEALPGPSPLKRSDSSASVTSWISLSDISWVEVESQAAEHDWEYVLDERKPQMEEVTDLLRKMDLQAVTELSSFHRPPVSAKVTMEVVCKLLGERPASDDDYWKLSKRLLSDGPALLDRLTDLVPFVPPPRLEAIAPYMQRAEFQPDCVCTASKAAHGMCVFTRGLYSHHALRFQAGEAAAAAAAKRPREELVAEAVEAMDSLYMRDLVELKAFLKPPVDVSIVCGIVLHLTAGLDPCVPAAKAGGAKDASFKAAQKAMGNLARFITTLKDFQEAIDAGKVPRGNVVKARQLKNSMGVLCTKEHLMKKSMAAAGLCVWAVNTIAYYDLTAPPAPEPEARPEARPSPDKSLEAALQELKSLAKPPEALANVGVACGLLLGASEELDWKSIQKLFANPSDCAQQVRTAVASNLPAATLNRLRELLEGPDLKPQKLRVVSLPATVVVAAMNEALARSFPLDSLCKADITELKAMKAPPAPVIAVLQCVLALDPLGTGGANGQEGWEACKWMLGDARFLPALVDYQVGQATDAQILRARELLAEAPDEQGVKRSSAACAGILRWLKNTLARRPELPAPAA